MVQLDKVKIAEYDILNFKEFLIDMMVNGCPLKPDPNIQKNMYDGRRKYATDHTSIFWTDKNFERARREMERIKAQHKMEVAR